MLIDISGLHITCYKYPNPTCPLGFKCSLWCFSNLYGIMFVKWDLLVFPLYFCLESPSFSKKKKKMPIFLSVIFCLHLNIYLF